MSWQCLIQKYHIQAEIDSAPWTADEDALYNDLIAFINTNEADSVLNQLVVLEAKIKDQYDAVAATNEKLRHLEYQLDVISSSESPLFARSQTVFHGKTQNKHSVKEGGNGSNNNSIGNEMETVSMSDINVQYVEYYRDVLQHLMKSQQLKKSHMDDYSLHRWSEMDDDYMVSMMEALINVTDTVIMENITAIVSAELIFQSQEINQEFLDNLLDSMTANKYDLPERLPSRETCAGHLDAAKLIHSTLHQWNEDINKVDHLQGSSIIYGTSWTSDTYQSSTTWKSQPWYVRDTPLIRYIPSILESILPAGWDTYDLSPMLQLPMKLYNNIPSYIWHSLPPPFLSLLPTSMKLQIVPNAEIILSSDLSLGSCWPLDGQHGRVTLLLPYPVIPDEFTIEQYPTQFDGDSYLQLDQSSAPRMLRIVGYPPCVAHDCISKGFDTKTHIDLGTFEYKLVNSQNSDEKQHVNTAQSRSYQTFKISPHGCSEAFNTTKVCYQEGPFISALTVFIDSNWGNDHFTCIYRIRLHGRAK
jgi:hypothetical protein